MKLYEFAAMLRSSGASRARVLRRRLSRSSGTPDWYEEETFPDPSRWQTVTVLGTPEEVAPSGRLPEPLAELADLIETRMQPAPGDRGTELSARTKPAPRADSTGWKGTDPARQIRTALQHAKQLVEVGEVLSVEPQPAGKRRPGGLLVGLMTGADQEGLV